MVALRFLKEFLLHPREVGAVAVSSLGLAKLIVDAGKVREADVVIEFGPGSGVFTERILREKRETCDFLVIELNARFASDVSRRHPTVAVYHDSATNAKQYLEKHGHRQCDSIICGLPWAAFQQELQDRLLDTILEVLKPGGRFVTFAYLQGLLLPAGKAFQSKLHSRFNHVETSHTVWMNIPPAFVYTAIK